MRRSLTTPDRRQTPPPLAVVRQRKTPAAPRYTVSASGSPVRSENLLSQLKFCSLQSPMHYLSCEKSGLESPLLTPKDRPLVNFASNLLISIFGSRNQRLLRSYQPLVNAANALEESLKKLSDEQLRAKTAELKARYAETGDLDALLPEAFAVVREAAWRTLKMRHFDVQLIGGIALHQGKIAEMRTGEGKTLVATLAAY